MGYTTDFMGEIQVSPPLNEHEIAYLNKFSASRRMNVKQGPLYTESNNLAYHSSDVINYNDPNPSQPGLWCQWVPGYDGDSIEWDGNEKFYASPEWMKFIIQNLFSASARAFVEEHKGTAAAPELDYFTFDHVFNGSIDAQGEEPSDMWQLIVEDNVVKVATATVQYGEPEAI